MDDDQQFCLRWNNHQSTLISVFDTLLENGTLVDCTLAAEGKFLKAHKVVLSACSPYFAALLSQQYDKHPIFILKDIKFQELRAMMDYMYRGEVNISQDQLAALLKAAESLQIKGLSESRGGSTQKNENVVQKQPVPVVSKSGLTIEHKRPANKHPTSAATESDVSMSREGSTSPTSRKRKKFRRRSIEVNNMDNHDQLSNSSSQSQSIHMTSIPMTAASQITSATSAANVLNVTKKTDHHDSKKDMEQSQADDDEDDDKNDLEPPAQRQKHDMDVSHIKEKMQSTHSELLIEPKNEYDDGQDETVEDLTLDDEELLEDLDQAGPSHGGEGSSQGYAQWQVGQNQDEVFLAAQEAAGQHRDAQAAAEDLGITRIAGLSWAQWNARLAMPLVTHLQEGAQPIQFSSNETSQSPTNEDKYSESKVNGGPTQSYPCPDCGRYYKLKSSLRNHQKWECGKEPQFQCPFCAYKAKQKMHIGRHLERMHKDIVKSDKFDEATVAAATQSTSTNAFPANLSLPSSITMTPMPSALNLTNVNTTI
ncbi:longitudinals lacking protein, isoforms A/B/D/L isoform X8 [Bradysia coprophila]|uniref:longitudinals lacking protein, isoforms A/B/D/L isoform X8 n=1 Tax=Bradysia coprophila TaxID=38358 RepID=UPI00187DA61F|nr:longitudinals lacking protein, isoforms A/B/D/L isoform X8 [Bradysia coprophila]XP_037035564.1 longitudinals lacking protein, isoforms A/B/D/L isoform X8 [Bradysia coprophila]